MRRIARWKNGLKDQEAPMVRNRPAAISQDGQGLLVRPVMKNMRQNVRVVATRYLIEKVTHQHVASVREAKRFDQLACLRHRLGKFKQNTPQVLVRLQN